MIDMPLSVQDTPLWAFQEGAFTAQECQSIITLAKDMAFEPARCMTGQEFKEGKDKSLNVYGVNDELRNSNLVWLEHDDPDSEWIYKKLMDWGSRLNDEHFGYDLYGALEKIQITHYKEGDHFSAFHMDRMAFKYNEFPPRKLTLVVPLSHRHEYEGGNFEINDGGDTITTPQQQHCGDMLAFPSWLIHRVTPVTKGERWSLVLWLSGPRFR